MINADLIDILQCPYCSDGQLSIQSTESLCTGMTCDSCNESYRVNDGIPDLVPQKHLTNERWQLWTDHLEGYSSRDQFRQKKPSAAQERRWSAKLHAFAEFLNITQGKVLDVGCGPGRLRLCLDPDNTDYFGVDPLPNSEVVEFPFARAIAEFLPFQDETFSSVVVRSALDHFCDLEAFLRETRRVLQPDGRLFLEQVVHEVMGPVSAAKGLVHALKDWVDTIRMRDRSDDAPKHMNEFTRRAVLDSVSQYFDLERTREYSPNWYTPTQLFIALKPRAID